MLFKLSQKAQKYLPLFKTTISFDPLEEIVTKEV